jgi:RHS repeat-associated protein
MRILAGQYFDSETGLHYNWNRYYDPKTGRWISADRRSVAEHVRRWRANMGKPNQPPLELNPYAYVANNPLRWIDPTGFGAAGVAGEIIIYVGGAVTVGGIAVGNPIIIGAGLGAVAVGGGLQIYDTYQEGQDAKNAIDKAQETVDKINEIQREKQRQIDQLFPPQETPPDCQK